MVVMYVEFCGVSFVLLVFPTIALKFIGVPLPVKCKKPHYMKLVKQLSLVSLSHKKPLN